MSFSYAQIEQIWIQNGGNPAAAPMAAAIAMAESSGNPDALNRNTNGSTDRGLWQINDATWGPLSTTDITANARGAIQISHNGTMWSDWTTFKTGAYRQFLQGGVAPSGVGIPASTGTGGPNAINASLPLDPNCLMGQSFPLIGQMCFLNKHSARGLIGGLTLAGGTGVALVGIGFLLVYGLKTTNPNLSAAVGAIATRGLIR